ncbi:MAG TPA: glycosyltransferase, partial [Candidatus Dormibacteraeota bacterium]|nr:glycosyltransferase [Candidatus Dormibacteraeota bacterium]
MMSTAEQPLVSCIMPTADRRRFAPLAIQNFLQQDYPNRELVILDDGQDSIADLAPADPRVKYIRTTQRQTVGAKRNQCVQASQGNLIMHWDDDDWVAPYRIRYQVESLLR